MKAQRASEDAKDLPKKGREQKMARGKQRPAKYKEQVFPNEKWVFPEDQQEWSLNYLSN